MSSNWKTTLWICRVWAFRAGAVEERLRTSRSLPLVTEAERMPSDPFWRPERLISAHFLCQINSFIYARTSTWKHLGLPSGNDHFGKGFFSGKHKFPPSLSPLIRLWILFALPFPYLCSFFPLSLSGCLRFPPVISFWGEWMGVFLVGGGFPLDPAALNIMFSSAVSIALINEGVRFLKRSSVTPLAVKPASWIIQSALLRYSINNNTTTEHYYTASAAVRGAGGAVFQSS